VKLTRKQAYNRRYREDNKARLRAHNARWREQNRERFRAWFKRRLEEDPDFYKKAKRRILERRAGRPAPDRCEVCGAIGPVNFDHCHRRDVFRGWLCTQCNVILGMANDDPNRLRMLIAYLERTSDLMPPQLSLPGV